MSWGEAVRLVQLLRKDTSSQFAAAMEGWEFPIDRGTLATLDMFDVTVQANSDSRRGRPKPHPGRPFKVGGESLRHGKPRPMSEAVAILNRYGHQIPV